MKNQYVPYLGTCIVFDGPDACGKTTQIELTKKYLESKGFKCSIVREQYDLDFSKKISEVNLFTPGLEPITRLHLYQAMRYETHMKTTKRLLEEGQIVLLDRFVHSTLAYQGYASDSVSIRNQVEQSVLNMLKLLRLEGIKPALSFILLLTPEEAKTRLVGRGNMDEIEKWNMVYKDRVYNAYRGMAEGSLPSDRNLTVSRLTFGIHAHLTIEEVFERIKTRIDHFFTPEFKHLSQPENI